MNDEAYRQMGYPVLGTHQPQTLAHQENYMLLNPG